MHAGVWGSHAQRHVSRPISRSTRQDWLHDCHWQLRRRIANLLHLTLSSSFLVDKLRWTDCWIRLRNMISNDLNNSEFRAFRTVFCEQLSIVKLHVPSKKSELASALAFLWDLLENVLWTNEAALLLSFIIGSAEALPLLCVSCALWEREREREREIQREREREREKERESEMEVTSP